jgi:hypothetical protein
MVSAPVMSLIQVLFTRASATVSRLQRLVSTAAVRRPFLQATAVQPWVSPKKHFLTVTYHAHSGSSEEHFGSSIDHDREPDHDLDLSHLCSHSHQSLSDIPMSPRLGMPNPLRDVGH